MFTLAEQIIAAIPERIKVRFAYTCFISGHLYSGSVLQQIMIVMGVKCN